MSIREGGLRVVLFFTRGVSLRTWDKGGMFAREVALYKRLQERGVHVTFVTYGDEGDLEYADRIPGITICCNQSQAPPPKDGELPDWLDADAMRSADLIKTNQTDGAEIALRAARRFEKPLIARCGYMWSEFLARQHGEDSPQARRSRDIEQRVFHAANRVVVTTEAMKTSIVARFASLAGRVHVIPNYVDVRRFRPARDGQTRPNRLCYVGRLEQVQKNLRSLVAAIRDLDVEVDVIGDGPLRSELEAESAADPRLRLLGNLPNDRLPEHISTCAAFVLPSFYEGHPKALIEAMACGVPVIGTDVPGIRDVIRHGVTGWLCGTEADSLRAAIRTVLGDPCLAARLARNARQFVMEHYALDRIVELELAMYRETLGAPVGV